MDQLKYNLKENISMIKKTSSKKLLDETQVIRLKKMYSTRDYMLHQLAERFNISKSSLYNYIHQEIKDETS